LLSTLCFLDIQIEIWTNHFSGVQMSNKGFLLVVLLLLRFMNPANSQVKAKVDMIGGGNYTWMRNNVLQGEQPAFGFNFGTGIIVEPSPKWKRVSFGVNFLFSKKGYKQLLG